MVVAIVMLVDAMAVAMVVGVGVVMAVVLVVVLVPIRNFSAPIPPPPLLPRIKPVGHIPLPGGKITLALALVPMRGERVLQGPGVCFYIAVYTSYYTSYHIPYPSFAPFFCHHNTPTCL